MKMLHSIDILSDKDKREIFSKSLKGVPNCISGNHKVLTINGWKKVKDLKSKDWLVI